MARTAPLPPVDLRLKLTRPFAVEELQTLCLDLHMDSEGLRGGSSGAKAPGVGRRGRRKV